MRVSPALNDIAGPMLYRSVTIGESSHSFLEGYGDESEGPRLSMDKEMLLSHTQAINFRGHLRDCVYQCFGIHEGSWEGKTLRVASLRTSSWSGAVAQCPCLGPFQPQKVICEASDDLILRGIPPPEVFVGRITGRPSPIRPTQKPSSSPAVGNCPPPIRSVYVFWTARKEAVLEYSAWAWTRWIPPPEDDFNDFCLEFAQKAKQKTHSHETIVVNIESLWPENMRTETINQDAIDKCKAHNQRYIDRWDKDSQIEDGRFRTPEEMRKNTFKFVSMETYLTEYDWKGEFTEEEIVPWLEGIRRGRGVQVAEVKVNEGEAEGRGQHGQVENEQYMMRRKRQAFGSTVQHAEERWLIVQPRYMICQGWV